MVFGSMLFISALSLAWKCWVSSHCAALKISSSDTQSQPALKPTGKLLRSLLEQCLLIFGGGDATKACVFLPEAICFCVRRCLWLQNSLRCVFSSCIGMESVSVVCKGPRNSWHNVKNRFAFLVWLLVWQSASLLFVNHLVWGFIWFYFKP